MNRTYKVIWNEASNCFMAVTEYAKGKSKSSSTAVSSNRNTITVGARILRLSTLCIGLAAASLSMQATAIVIPIPGSNPITVDTDVGTITGLTNTTFSTTTTYTGGQAATQEQVSSAAAASRTEVVAGTNVNNVSNTPGGSGQNVYTVNADGASVSAGSGDVTVNGTLNTTTNVTDYAVDLSPATKANIVAAKTEVVAGTNVSVTNVPGGGGQNVYTVDGEKTTVSTTSPGLTLVGTPNSTTNVTDYAVDLSGATVTSLGLANTSIQTVITQVNGTNVKTLNNTNNTANFTNIGSGNIVLSDNGGAINVDTAPTLNLTSVITGGSTLDTNGLVNGNTTVNGNGVSIASGPSMTTGGVNAGGQAISNVFSGGSNVNNAANIGDVQAAAAAARTEVVAGTNVTVTNNLGGSLQNVYTIDAEKTTVSTTSPGLTVVGTPNSTTNVTDYAVDLSASTVTSLGLANSAIQTVVTQIDGTAVKTITKSNNTANFVTGSNMTLTDVGGAIEIATKPNLNLTSVTTGNTTINNSGFVNGSTTVNGTGVTIAGGPSMTTGGINAGNQVITGVANGTAPNHAVNFGQLTALGYRVDDVEDDANAGISSAMAMASLPQPYLPGKSMVSGAMGTYNGEGAMALGISTITDDGRWVIKASATVDTQSNFGGSVGAGYQF